MQLSLFFYALAMLCSLASVAFVTLDVGRRANAAVAFAFVLAVVAVRPDGLPEPVWVGGLVASLAVAALFGGEALKGVPFLRATGVTSRVAAGVPYLVATSGGALAGTWVAMLEVVGLPLPAAVVVAAAPLVVAVCFTRANAGFAPAVLREEALLVILLLGVLVAIAPGVASGWQSAAVLNLQQKEVASHAVPAWTLLLTLGAAALGGLYTVWMRR